jgi:hypothetical protein
VSEGKSTPWLKYGCFGCLGCVGLIVFLAASLVGIAWLNARSEEPESRVLTHPSPAAPASPAEPAPAPVAPVGGAEPAPTETKEAPLARTAGKVVLDLADGEFHVEPGAAGEPIRVEASYDRNSFELEERSETADDGSWIYEVSFRHKKSASGLLNVLQRFFSKGNPKVVIHLPPDVPLALETTIRHGGAQVELGGLRLSSCAIAVTSGGMELGFGSPLPEPMERLEIRTDMGGAEINDVGNASPRVLDVEFRMGGMELDLTGEWRADAEISVEGSMGGAEVRLPSNARIEGVPGRKFEGPATGETKLPTLRFKTSSAMGEIEFR